MNRPIRLSLFEVLGMVRNDAGQDAIAGDLQQSLDDDDTYFVESPIDPDWAPRGYRDDE